MSAGVTQAWRDPAKDCIPFVVKDEETMDTTGYINLTIPYQIAYIEGDLTGVPTTKYYERT